METGTDSSSQGSDIESLKLVVGTYILIFSMKLAVYFMTGVMAIGVIVISMLIAAIPLISMYRQKKHGAAARAQFLELFNDEFGLFAALAGTLFIMWGQPIADPIASIVVATIIAYNAIGLFRENLSFLLGRSPGPELLKTVEDIALSVGGVLGVHELRAEYIGPDTIHVGMHIDVLRGTPFDEIGEQPIIANSANIAQ